jgi:hypothetical protein
MRAIPLALAALLAVPLLPALPGAPPDAPSLPAAPPEGSVELSHGFFTPYMHIAALDIPRGIRPGSWLQIGDANCTASFVLRDTLSRLYITTAGHCTESIGQRAAIKEGVLIAALGESVEFGTVVAHWPQGLDAALIRIDEDKYDLVNPTMIGWGGPTGLVTEIPEGPIVRVLHYGWGWVTWYDHATRCRTGITLPIDLEDWTSSTWWTAEIGGGGDSGSATMTEDGKALGILDWARSPVVPTPTGAFVSARMGGVRLDAALNRWNAQGWGLSLVEGGPLNPVCLPEPPVP